MKRVNQQLADASVPMFTALESNSRQAPAGLTYGTYGEIRLDDGDIVRARSVIEDGKRALVPPEIPTRLWTDESRYFNAHAPRSGTHYRVLATPASADPFGNARILI